MKPIDNETIFDCPICHQPINVEEYYPKEHDGHCERAWHELEAVCQMCEGDEPVHCPVGFENMVDAAEYLRD